jgi:DNA-binding response OmpR family regulator
MVPTPTHIEESDRIDSREHATLPNPVQLMILDRDLELVQALRVRADRRSWESHVLRNPTTRRLLARMKIHALVVDPTAIGPDPWRWIERVASGLPELAVVVCAGPSTVSERVRALQLGVDDWLSKPTHPDEVIARVESAVRRRRHSAIATQSLQAGELELRREEKQVQVGGVSAGLTGREFGVLRALIAERGKVVERSALYSRVWGYEMVPGDRSVDVHIRKLRRKLARVSPEWVYIHTQFRIGYRFHAERRAPAVEPSHTNASLSACESDPLPTDDPSVSAPL